jgi:hypothetical protein
MLPNHAKAFRTITNVSNVGLRASGTGGLCTDGRAIPTGAGARWRSEANERSQALACEIGEALIRMSGNRDARRHHSEGFHMRLALRLPEHLIRQALAATRDAVERARSGERGGAKEVSAYFAGVVKRMAEEAGVELGLRQRGPGAKNLSSTDDILRHTPWRTTAAALWRAKPSRWSTAFGWAQNPGPHAADTVKSGGVDPAYQAAWPVTDDERSDGSINPEPGCTRDRASLWEGP